MRSKFCAVAIIVFAANANAATVPMTTAARKTTDTSAARRLWARGRTPPTVPVVPTRRPPPTPVEVLPQLPLYEPDFAFGATRSALRAAATTTAQEDGRRQLSAAVTCADQRADCATLATQGHCTNSNKNFMERNCAVACGVCVDAVTHALERDALLQLFSSTRGAVWKRSDGWATNSSDMCAWHGVSCLSHGRVVQIDLRNNQLNGTIPAALGRLAELIILALKDNTLHGTLPEELSVLREMTYLDSSSNALTGTLPASFHLLGANGGGSLTTLLLGNNGLTGQLPDVWKELVGLQMLILEHNDLEGELPAGWGQLGGSLKTLALNDNRRLSGSFPAAWRLLGKLENLHLQNCNISGAMSGSIGFGDEWKQLKELLLDNNALSGTFPAYWGGMPKLEVLSAPGNRLSGSLPPEWSTLTALRQLRVGSNVLTGSLPASWSAMTALQRLSVEDNALTGSLPASWSMRQLNALVAHSNKLTGAVPIELLCNAQLTQIELRNNALSGDLDSIALNCALRTNLALLDLSNNKFTGFPTMLGVSVNISSGEALPVLPLRTSTRLVIRLNNNPFTNARPPWQWLDLAADSGGCEGEACFRPSTIPDRLIRGDGALFSRFMPQLVSLDLAHTGMTDTPQRVLQPLASLTQLVSVDLSHNDITGELHAPYASFTVKFQGYQPHLEHAFTNMVSLQLQHNPKLGGFLPDAIGAGFGTLQVLSVEHCDLSGAIPETSTFEQLNVLRAAGNPKMRAATSMLPTFMAPSTEWKDVLHGPYAGRRQCAAMRGDAVKSEDGIFTLDPAYVGHSLAQGACRCALGLEQRGGACTVCTPGHFRQNTSSCVACAPGRAQPRKAQASCNDCATGQHQPLAGQATCNACAAGQYQDTTGAEQCVQCVACSTGVAKQGCQGLSAGYCVACHPGRFANAVTQACETCPAGTVSDTEGATACRGCHSQEFQPKAGQPFCMRHTVCTAGAFQTAVPNATADRGCTPCAAGTISNTTNAETCDPCPGGSFQPAAGQASCTQHAMCAKGERVTRQPTATTDRGCAPCGAGYFSDATNTPSCNACLLGRYQALSGQTRCDACDAGARGKASAALPRTGAASHCEACPAKTFSAATGASTCTACTGCDKAGEARSGCGGASAGVCIACAVGTSKADASAGSCVPCADGFFQNETGQAQCTACASMTCPNDAHRKGCGGASAGYCGTCSPGTFIQGSACIRCDAGRFSAAENAAECAACPVDEFQPAAGKGYCLPHSVCAKGERSASAPIATADRGCTPCAAGTISNTTNAETCDPCPGGSFQPAAGQASCTQHAMCAKGERVTRQPTATTDRGCAPCGAGYFSDATNAAKCRSCPGGKFQNTNGQPFCETYTEGFAYKTNALTGAVEQKKCPQGMQCSGESVIPCVNKISDPATGKCISCKDKHFANNQTNECMECPHYANGDIVDGVVCDRGTISIQKGYFAVNPSGAEAHHQVPRSLNTTQIIKCRDPEACSSTIVASNGSMTARTQCLKNTAGVLCGVCAPTYGFVGKSCLKCSKDNSLATALMALASIIFILMYWRSVKDALKHARVMGKNKYVVMTTLKILMTFLYKTSLLSNYQLDWGASMRYIFSSSSAASSGDPTGVVLANCLGLNLHMKMKVVCMLPFAALLLPLPPIIFAKVRKRRILWGAPLHHTYCR